MKKEESFKNMHNNTMNNFMRYPDEFVARYFASNSWNNVLDFGCAGGRHTQMLCELATENETSIIGGGEQRELKNHKIYALDLDDEVLQKVKNRAPYSITLMANKIDTISKNSLDAVLAWGCLHMNPLKEQENLIQTFYKLLKKDGVIISNHTTLNDYRRNIDENTGLLKEKILLYFYSLESTKALYENNGFNIIKLLKITKTDIINNNILEMYYIIAKKQ